MEVQEGHHGLLADRLTWMTQALNDMWQHCRKGCTGRQAGQAGRRAGGKYYRQAGRQAGGQGCAGR